MEKKMLINGMMCGHCKAVVEKALCSVDGVESCTVDLEAKTAVITMEKDIADDILFEAVKAKRFTPVKML